MTTAAGIYVRISQDRDGTAESPERQEKACRRLIEAKGWTVHRVYSDRDLSGFSGVNRPEYEAMLSDARSGVIGAIVAWKVDRLVRNRPDYFRLSELVEGGTLLALESDPVDTSTPLGQVVLDLLASMARMESETISLRVRSAFEESARKGRPHSVGGRAWGYSDDWQVIPTEAEVIRGVARDIIDGESLGSITRRLNDDGHRTGRGAQWTAANLGKRIRSPHLAGLRSHHGELHAGTWEAVLDRETWEHVRAILDRNQHRGGGARRHLLTGVARCGLCGTGLISATSGKGVKRYACHPTSSGCGKLGIVAAGLEEHVSGGVIAALSGPALGRMLSARASKPAAETEAKLAQAFAQLDDLATDHGEGLITRREWHLARDKVAANIARLTNALQVDLASPLLHEIAGTDLPSWWEAATVKERREVIGAVVSSVTVGPMRRGGAGFDPNRVTVEWAA